MAATTMMTINHVLDCENELNDNLYNLKMCSGKNKNSPMRKILKPLMKLIKKRTQSCKKLLAKKNEKNQQQQQLDVFTEEVDNQNNSNEALEQRLLGDLTKADEGAAIITIGQDGKMTVVPVSCYVPVHFLPTLAGDFFWTTLPQQVPVSEFYHKETIISQHQQIELQVI